MNYSEMRGKIMDATEPFLKDDPDQALAILGELVEMAKFRQRLIWAEVWRQESEKKGPANP